MYYIVGAHRKNVLQKETVLAINWRIFEVIDNFKKRKHD